MGRKIFISYKYKDTNVQSVPRFSGVIPKARDYVSWLEDKFQNRTEHHYKGESDDEDLSGYPEEYIWNHLKNKMWDSSITIVLISPNMRKAGQMEKVQWIPREISYSLRLTPRGNQTSQRNAVLAVVLPDKHGRYEYYSSMTLFSILKANIVNGYIPVVAWDAFKYDCDRYINKAYEAQRMTPERLLKINI